MRKTKKVSMLVTLLLLFAVAKLPAQAQTLPGKHPGYIHALGYLRTARWLLMHQPGDAKVYEGEETALHEVESALAEIKAAAIDDGKNINDHAQVQVFDHGSRLLRAIDNLQSARNQVASEEQNQASEDLRHRSLFHLDRAIAAANQAHDAWIKDVHH